MASRLSIRISLLLILAMVIFSSCDENPETPIEQRRREVQEWSRSIEGVEDILDGPDFAELKLTRGEDKELARQKWTQSTTLAANTIDSLGADESPFNKQLKTRGLVNIISDGNPPPTTPSKEQLQNLFLRPDIYHPGYEGDAFQCSVDPDRNFTEADVLKGKKYYKLVHDDLEKQKVLAQALLRAASLAEIRQHEKALEEIPISISRKLLLDKFKEDSRWSGDNGPQIILPPGAKKAIESARKKYDKLEEIKTKINQFGDTTDANSCNALRAWASTSFVLSWAVDSCEEQHRQDLVGLIEDYNEMDLTPDLKNLKVRGFNLESSTESVLNQPLTSAMAFATNISTNGNGQNIQERVATVKEQIEKAQEDAFKSFYEEIFKQSGNTDVVKNSEGKVDTNMIKRFMRGLPEKAVEVTGWEFSTNGKFSLAKTTLEELDDQNADQDKQALYSQVYEQLKDPERNLRRFDEAKNALLDSIQLPDGERVDYRNKLTPETVQSLILGGEVTGIPDTIKNAVKNNGRLTDATKLAHNLNNANAVTKALSFVDNYQDLQKNYADADWLNIEIFEKITDKESKLADISSSVSAVAKADSAFDNWKEAFCKEKRSEDNRYTLPDECSMTNIMKASDRLDLMPETASQLVKMLGINLPIPVDFKSPEFTTKLNKFLENVRLAQVALKENYPECANANNIAEPATLNLGDDYLNSDRRRRIGVPVTEENESQAQDAEVAPK